jgi:hypothetical protein
MFKSSGHEVMMASEESRMLSAFSSSNNNSLISRTTSYFLDNLLAVVSEFPNSVELQHEYTVFEGTMSRLTAETR